MNNNMKVLISFIHAMYDGTVISSIINVKKIMICYSAFTFMN